MRRSRAGNYLRLLRAFAWLALSSLAVASEYHGKVTFGGLPLPGATVTATNGGRRFSTVTDRQGFYSFPDLPDGAWTIEVEMQCFTTIRQEVSIAPNAPAINWELKLLPLDKIKAQMQPVLSAEAMTPQPRSEAAKPQEKKLAETNTPEDSLAQRAADGLLINGSVNNAAISPFAQLPAFGNLRSGPGGLYNGGLGLIFDNSALDARPYSLSGQDTPKAEYNRATIVATFGGPLNIPHLLTHGPNSFLAYQWSRNSNATTLSGLMPDSTERSGDLSGLVTPLGQPVEIFNPTTGAPFPGNLVPVNRQAQALLKLYPLPNVANNPLYNFQVPVLNNVHQDALQLRLDQTLGHKDQVYGGFAFQSTRSGDSNIFGFLDTTDALGIDTNANWSHRFSQRLFLNAGYRFSRMATHVNPYWENRANISGDAGITGNNQDAMNWGPPTLAFSSGTAGLTDVESSFDRNQTSAWSYSMLWARGRHNITFGADFRRQEFNYLSQQNPRGTFTFTGAATQGTANGVKTGGSDLADFLIGIPDTSALAFGNADKYFRESVYDAYITDDWRIDPQLTLNAGIRWEYGVPITELHDRLVNLDITSGFRAAAPVVANNPMGSLTGETYPSSLIRPDKRGFEPRIGVAWRPIAGSSLLVRAGYGIYDDTSVYQTIALQMSQQAPLSKSLSVENSAACPLTLANGFNPCSSTTESTYAIDPDYRIGYAQNWQLAIQRDLPGSLQLTATYLGIKGTRGVQEFLPNTFPIGAANSCPTCPVGFAYLTSGGNSTRQAGELQLRRRMHNGLTATLQYTYSKALDDDAALGGQGAGATAGNTLSSNSPSGEGASSSAASPGSPTIAQNWLALSAERGPSTFDQRHLLTAQLQYTTGMGMGGGTLLSGWRGSLLKEWTVLTRISAGSGMPQTPVYLAAVPDTGVTGTIRPDTTGASPYAAPAGFHLNQAAYAAPRSGEWGNAGRDSIVGPSQFTLDASLGRTIRLHDRFNLDFRIDSTNLLNHVTYTTWNTTINSTLFGLPAAANAMRSIQTTMRLRF